MTMKFSTVACVLVVGVSLLLPSHSTSFSISPPVEYQLSVRRHLREQSFQVMEPVGEEKPKVLGGMKRKDANQTSKERHRNDDEEGLIYYVDYHGVTTHPSPLPRHPKP